MMRITWSSSRKVTLVSSRRPLRSRYTWREPLTMISVTVLSRRSGSSGPKPSISATTSSIRRRRSSRMMANPFAPTILSTIASTLSWMSLSPAPSNGESEALAIWSIKRSLTSRSDSSLDATCGFRATGIGTRVAVTALRVSASCCTRSIRRSRDMTKASLNACGMTPVVGDSTPTIAMSSSGIRSPPAGTTSAVAGPSAPLRRLEMATNRSPLPGPRGSSGVDGSSLGPLTLPQKVFWDVAIALLVASLMILVASACPSSCECRG